MGITTTTAAVSLEFKTTPQEREKMEEFVLRLRGVSQGDVQKAREGAIRLKEVRFLPRADLAPMKAVRPRGPQAEEAQDEGAGHKEEQGQQEIQRGEARQDEPRKEDRREEKARGAGSYLVQVQVCMPQRARGNRRVPGQALQNTDGRLAESQMHCMRHRKTHRRKHLLLVHKEVNSLRM